MRRQIREAIEEQVGRELGEAMTSTSESPTSMT
jgi:hypothetical protein